MASSDLETRAKEAFIDDDFELAVDLYSQAISVSPKNAELFAYRAQTNIKLANFTESVADADKAIELDPSMAKAYLRKGMACIKLEEYQTAKAALEVGASILPGDSRFTKLIKECDEGIAEETGELMKQSTDAPMGVDKAVASSKDAEPAITVANQAPTLPSAKPKYRYEFFQKPEEAVLTIFAKGVPAKNVTVDFGDQILSVTIGVPGEDAHTFQPRLFGKIIPTKCRYEVLSTKIEIRLAKAEPIQWKSLEFSKDSVAVQRINVPSGQRRPAYPSSKSNKDWDKLEAQMKKEALLVESTSDPLPESYLPTNDGQSPPMNAKLQEMSAKLQEMSNSFKSCYSSTSSHAKKLAEEHLSVQEGDDPKKRLEMAKSRMKDSLVRECLIFLNTANKEQLKEELSGIGELRATSILELRDESPNPFKSLDDLQAIGMPAKHVEGMIKKMAEDIFT